ncbi:ankyrin repeat domain-containing protein [Orientia tsutsugamushi]|uniref:Ankyrin repeat protein with 2 ankyrin repeats n=1 Tax=Orientia tsutsugamushi (strain Boryong) TaxID=357244 RepID=A5CFH2_ORITB|nr:ankyrin repeat domain-containing protein [Orientia tsutsugamushi]CAM81146.1 ankyrin repeat protein with 2 ankyrin repeats [Orientia tsutsugamushi str. Boryong]
MSREELLLWYKEQFSDSAYINKSDIQKISKISPENATDLLPYAVVTNNFPVAKFLIKRKATICTKDEYDNFPINYVDIDHEKLAVKLIKLFVKKDKNCINKQNSLGRTILHTAASKGKYNITKYLLKSCAKQNITDEDGDTAEKLALNYKTKMLFQSYNSISEEVCDVQRNTQNLTNEASCTIKYLVNNNTDVRFNFNTQIYADTLLANYLSENGILINRIECVGSSIVKSFSLNYKIKELLKRYTITGIEKDNIQPLIQKVPSNVILVYFSTRYNAISEDLPVDYFMQKLYISVEEDAYLLGQNTTNNEGYCYV